MNSIHDICKKYNITNYTINDDESIDVNGNVYLYDRGLTELPLTFNRIEFDFWFSNNNLTSLKGGPRWVGDWFSCGSNKLTSLEFSPEYVGNDFFCSDNYLIDNYCDTEIVGGFYTSLKHDGLTKDNYNEWRKLYKRKQILDDIFNM
jgi:hypothetical protein